MTVNETEPEKGCCAIIGSTQKYEIMERMHHQDGVTLLTGIELVAATFILTITPPDGVRTSMLLLNFILSGGAAIVLGVAALIYFRQWEEWQDVALGLWLTASPWILGFAWSQTATWTAVDCGVMIAAMGAWRTARETGNRAY